MYTFKAPHLTLAKAAGWPLWQPSQCPKEVTPIKIRLLLLVTTRGPPESPWHTLLPPAPLVQTLEGWTYQNKLLLHTAFVITGKSTKFRVGLTLPPSLVKPKPDAVPVKPANWLLISLPDGRAMNPMLFEVDTAEGKVIIAMSFLTRLGLQFGCITTLEEDNLVPPL